MIRKPVGLTAPYRRDDDDDDIQDYKKPWVGLTDEERENGVTSHNVPDLAIYQHKGNTHIVWVD